MRNVQSTVTRISTALQRNVEYFVGEALHRPKNYKIIDVASEPTVVTERRHHVYPSVDEK